MEEGSEVGTIIENASGIVNVWHHPSYRKPIIYTCIIVACAAGWCAKMEFNVGDLRDKHVETTKAVADTNRKIDKLDSKVDHGIEVLGNKMDKLSDDTHTLMGEAKAIRNINP